MDAENRWWVTELLAADCEKAWIHPGWEDTMQKWYEWLKRTQKKDEEGKDAGNACKEGETNDQVCGGKCWTLAQNHEAHSMKRRCADFGKRGGGCQADGSV